MIVNSISSRARDQATFSTLFDDSSEMPGVNRISTRDDYNQSDTAARPGQQLNLMRKLWIEQQSRVSRAGQELLALRALDGSVGKADGLTAIAVSRDENSSDRFTVQLIRLRSNGESQVLYSSNNLDKIQELAGDEQPDLQGIIFEQQV